MLLSAALVPTAAPDAVRTLGLVHILQYTDPKQGIHVALQDEWIHNLQSLYYYYLLYAELIIPKQVIRPTIHCFFVCLRRELYFW